MKRRTKADTAPSELEIVVGYVTPFVVQDRNRVPVHAFGTLREARAHFPSAKVSDGVERKARELGE